MVKVSICTRAACFFLLPLCLLRHTYVKRMIKKNVCYNRNAESKIIPVIRNDIKSLIDRQKLTRYRFWKDTGLNRETAYRLYDDPNYVPGAEVMDKIAKTYGWHPGAYLFYLSDELATRISA